MGCIKVISLKLTDYSIFCFPKDGSILCSRSGGSEHFASPELNVLPVLGSDGL